MPVKGRTKQDVLLEFRRAEILDAARKICASRGYHEMTVDEIAQAAGIAKGTVYLYFRSKHEIYWAMIEQVLAVLHDQVRAQLSQPGPIEDVLRRFVTTKMTFFEEHRDLVRLLQSALDTAMSEGVLRRMRPDMTALTIFEVTRGSVMHRTRGWSRAPLQDDIEFTFNFIWRGLSGS